MIREMGKEIARRIHKKEFNEYAVTIKKIKSVLARLDTLTELELVNEKMSDRLVSCVKVNLIRMLHYNNGIKKESADKHTARPIVNKDLEKMEALEVIKND